MLFLVVLVIALGWAGWFWAWGRDRYVSNRGFGLPASPMVGRTSPTLAAPRTASMARKRRREVLTALVLAALLTLILARAWSLLWVVHLLVDAVLVTYGWAVYSLEQGRPVATTSAKLVSPLMNAPRVSLQPILDTDGLRPQPGTSR